jgi:hypothetical protein
MTNQSRQPADLCRYVAKSIDVPMAKKRLKRRRKKLCVDVVETREIVLVDEFGTPRATVFCSGGNGGKGGFTVIQINDDNGRPRIELQVDEHGNPCIRLNTPNDGCGVSMAVNDERGNGLSVGDFEGKPCIMLGVPHPDSQDPPGLHPHITLIDERSRRGWTAFNGEYELPGNGKPTEDNSAT